MWYTDDAGRQHTVTGNDSAAYNNMMSQMEMTIKSGRAITDIDPALAKGLDTLHPGFMNSIRR